jgi:hypothetical protein
MQEATNEEMAQKVNATQVRRNFIKNSEIFNKKLNSGLLNQTQFFKRHLEDNELNEIAADLFKSFDNNLFNMQYGTLTSLDNFKNKKVEVGLDTDKPKKTMDMATRFLFDENLKIFHVSNNLNQMLQLTKNKIFSRKLPFNSFFIDSVFRFETYTFFGMLVCAVKNMNGQLYFDLDSKDYDSVFFYSIGIDDSDYKLAFLYSSITPDGLFKPELNPTLSKKAALFVCNFLDLLNDPNIKFVKGSESFGHSSKLIKRNYERQLIDTSKTYLIKIEDPLRRYIDNFHNLIDEKHFHVSWFVRGHFRTLKAKRYGENIGKKCWIAPYRKGIGPLLRKQYVIEGKEV